MCFHSSMKYQMITCLHRTVSATFGSATPSFILGLVLRIFPELFLWEDFNYPPHSGNNPLRHFLWCNPALVVFNWIWAYWMAFDIWSWTTTLTNCCACVFITYVPFCFSAFDFGCWYEHKHCPGFQDMIENVLEIKDTQVSEVMTPLVDVVAIDARATLIDFHNLWVLHEYSRYTKLLLSFFKAKIFCYFVLNY